MEKWVIRPKQATFIWQKIVFLVFKRPIIYSCRHFLPLLPAVMALGILSASTVLRTGMIPLTGGLVLWFGLCRLQFQIKWLSYILPALFFYSALRTCLIFIPAEHQAQQNAGKEFLLQGIICTIPEGKNTNCQVIIRQNNGISLAFFGPQEKLMYGNTIEVNVLGILPSGRKNPGGFDEAAWLSAQGIFLKTVPAGGAEIRVTKPETGFSLTIMGSKIRYKIYEISKKLLNPQEAALLSGLLLGDTGNISAETKSNFRKAGLAHLTSVSGSNVSSLLVPAACLFRRSRVGRKSRLWLMLAVLVGFGFLTGWQVSVTRAILMAGIVLAGQLWHRKTDAVNVLSLAALLLLLIQPLAALSVGFWLSLSATASLVIFTNPVAAWLKQRLKFPPQAFCQCLAAAVCTQLAVMPLISTICQEINFTGILANLPALLLTAAITYVSVIILPLSFVIVLAAKGTADNLLPLIGRPLGVCLDLLEALADNFGSITAGRLFPNELNLAFWLAWGIFLLSWMQRFGYLSGLPERFWRILSKLRLPLAVSWLLLLFFSVMNQPLVQVWFFDVGQGDAILIKTRSNETVLIDGGNQGCGYNILQPALDSLGIDRIDLAIATHGHADHTGGLIELIDSRRIDTLIMPPAPEVFPGQTFEKNLADELKKSAQLSGIKVSEAARGDTIVLGSSIFLKVLSPDMDSYPMMDEQASGNEQSLIIEATLAGHKVLLTADCTQAVEEKLLVCEAWQPAEILKVAHHGSRLATSADFLEAVKPAAAVISVGANLYGHPAPDTLQRLQSADCQILRTDQQGAILLRIDRESWVMKTLLPGPERLKSDRK